VSLASFGANFGTLVLALRTLAGQLDMVGWVHRPRARGDAWPLTWDIKFAVTLLKQNGTDPDVMESP
jgi:hypothetical protein